MEPNDLQRRASRIKAGVDFQLCHTSLGDRVCGFCNSLQKARCELLAALDHQYTDDPRNKIV